MIDSDDKEKESNEKGDDTNFKVKDEQQPNLKWSSPKCQNNSKGL